jgi:large subunit ribosomal protein L9
MKVILLKDVAKIGRRSQIVEVPDGYARNQLIPKGMAQSATPENMKRIDKMKAAADASSEAGASRFETAVTALREKVVQIEVDVNEKGHAFKAVHENDVAAAAKEVGINIEESMINISSPVKAVGEFEIELVNDGQKAKFTIEVVKK